MGPLCSSCCPAESYVHYEYCWSVEVSVEVLLVVPEVVWASCFPDFAGHMSDVSLTLSLLTGGRMSYNFVDAWIVDLASACLSGLSDSEVS